MSLNFILGQAKFDHRQEMIEQMRVSMAEHPKDQYFVLVPNHIKFNAEVGVLNALKEATDKTSQSLYANGQIQVFSFTRLAWYFMKNAPTYQLPRLSNAGLSMLIYHIIAQHQTELTVFAGELNQTGFINQLVRQFSELKVGQVSAADLQHIAGSLETSEQADLGGKLHDLAIVYEAYTETLSGNYVDNADLVNQLTDFLVQGNELKHAHIYLDGYATFSAQEQQLVTVMMKQAASVTVSLVMQHAPKQTPELGDLFYEPSLTYLKLVQLARENQVQIQLDTTAKKLRVSTELAKLDDFWVASVPAKRLPVDQLSAQTNLRVFTAETRLDELNQVARQIRTMVAQQPERYHYRDFLVLSRHLAPYENFVGPVFDQMEIPYFDDSDKPMDKHPLIELISALFDVRAHYYRYQDVMRLLKTELLIPRTSGQAMSVKDFRQALSLTENWVLKTGIEGSRWVEKEDWTYWRLQHVDDETLTEADVEVQRQINVIHHFIGTVLPPFFKQLDKANNGTEAAKILYQFLADNGVIDCLNSWRVTATDNGDLDRASRNEQAWNTFTGILDEYVSLLGETADFDIDEFAALLLNGFEGTNYTQIPATLDQVTISETGIVQLNDYQVVFLIGATDDVMPDQVAESSILTDGDRDRLAPKLADNQFLTLSAGTRMTFDSYINYMGFLTGCQQLILSYPQGGTDENGLQPSRYVTSIVNHFQLPVVTYTATPNVATQQASALQPFIGSPRFALTNLIKVSYQAKETQLPLPKPWVFVYRWLRLSSVKTLTDQLLAGIDYRNTPQPLRPDIVQGLYGDQLNTSISQLETFYRNQYEYFLKFGLRLNERDEFELSAASTGEYFHMALDQLMKLVVSRQLDLSQLSESAINDLVSEVMPMVNDQPQFAILNSSHRMGYIRNQLIETIKRMATIIGQQQQITPMRTLATEVLFGHVGADSGMPALSFKLHGNRHINVRGKIDRVDGMNVGSKEYLSVVDYKSGRRTFDFEQAYYGLSMQMLTYLDALRQDADSVSPSQLNSLAGALYLHIQSAGISLNKLGKGKRLDLNDLASISDALLSAHKYQGVLVADPVILTNLDQDIADGGHSKVYPLALKKDKTLSATAKTVITAEQLNDLLSYEEQLIVNAGNQIFAGSDKLNPFQNARKQTGLQYSPYTAVMRFDAMLPENRYHVLDKLTPADVLHRIDPKQQEADRDGNN
ncbi:PD-(D/E)XK nuclease family protein [Furfurilactobacillus rossiae]|uniref:ATP-dependent helicase/deoxyribonuclease subunit B n=1 Tax=Furfurilactobacillus rossiae DSM 15814 TaxID=1114972 RepID=A0A0R1RAY3_9LACO|nr:PD-(D/E)XK nuclease family protein [Furfurilactobacillus rossiae]KRL54333.1 ATP-dependent helicase deoxyribonuclease subunit B [Furfurilactobacillus rossiae DSM 15814]QFR66939.1 ATP-dependent helicase [Furfurilactobacillus rossiae]QLE62437.1 ATP-dependent nuclease subunit B [Furfurilactobacillus rossiae]